jgi:hypothetical protein
MEEVEIIKESSPEPHPHAKPALMITDFELSDTLLSLLLQPVIKITAINMGIRFFVWLL